jgi:hypothetical protein
MTTKVLIYFFLVEKAVSPSLLLHVYRTESSSISSVEAASLA